MTGRDRMVAVGVGAIVIVGGVWMEVVSPERAKVTALNGKVQTAQQSVQTAQSELSKAKFAQARYTEAYSSVVQLGRAVPADQEIPGLVYELDQASNDKHVEFASISPSTSGTGAQTPKSSGESSSGGGFEALPFTFTFNGSFNDLYNLMTTVQGYATTTAQGDLKVSGRLLTVQQFKLTPASTSTASDLPSGKTEKKGAPGEHLSGTVSATAYVLPPGTQATGGATSSGPSGSGSSAAKPASSSGSGSGSGPAPATIKAGP
jgi:Tfp pilus assembly protein PilO